MAEKWERGPDGLMKLIDTETGEVLAEEKKKPGRRAAFRGTSRGPGRPAKKVQETHHYIRGPNGNKLWVPKGTNPDDIPRTIYPYNETTRDQILLHVTQGMSLAKIGDMEDLPPVHVIWKWLREHPEFRAMMEEAKKARAEFYADRVIAIAEQEHVHPDDVPMERLRKDVFQWGAEVNDPATYGKRTKIVAEAAPAALLVDTGIRRDGDEEPAIETTGTPVGEETHSS